MRVIFGTALLQAAFIGAAMLGAIVIEGESFST